MRLSRRLMINLVAVALLGVISVGWVVKDLVGSGLGQEPFRVVADFAGSGGVFTDQEVTYRGVLVGKVGALELNEDGVDIELLIEPDWESRIPAAVQARVQSKSAVGEQYVNLVPDGRSSGDDMLRDGDRIARDDTKLPVDFQRLLRSFDGVLREVSPEAARGAIEELSGGIAGREGSIGTILESLAELADAFADVAPQQQAVLSNSTQAGRAFLSTKEELTEALRAADDVFAGIGDEPEELRRMFIANDRFARDAVRLLARWGDELHSGVRGLADLATYQKSQSDAIVDALTYLPQFLHAIEDSSIPWRAPDGREFYRIRVGLVLERDPATWPCKYVLPFEHERHAHVRDRRATPKAAKCLPEDSTSSIQVKALVKALLMWLKDHPEVAAQPASQEKAGDILEDVIRDRFRVSRRIPRGTLSPGP